MSSSTELDTPTWGGASSQYLGSLVTVRATGTAGELVEHALPPGYGRQLLRADERPDRRLGTAVLAPGFATRHARHAQDEALYILEGELSVSCGDRTLTATAGSLVALPGGIVHSLRVKGARPVRALRLETPVRSEPACADSAPPAREAALPPPWRPDLEQLVAPARWDRSLGSMVESVVSLEEVREITCQAS
jgi:mannose-6-phosphate isomerase-like protein (cupin superfamily)